MPLIRGSSVSGMYVILKSRLYLINTNTEDYLCKLLSNMIAHTLPKTVIILIKHF
jgi:hypothetical protein